MEQFFKDSKALLRMRDGALGAYVDEFARQLSDEGYARASARYALQLVADLGRWMVRRKLLVTQLTEQHFERYLEYRTRQGRFRSGDPVSVRRMQAILREQGIIAAHTPTARNPAQRLMEDFCRYLAQERRLSPATVRLYRPTVSALLGLYFGEGRVHLDRLRASDVVQFVRQEAARLHHPKRAKVMTSALRAFLQYVHYQGLIHSDLRSSVPTVANWSMAELPRALPSEDIERLLRACNPLSAVGRRDRAILLLLARLGLRAGEVVRLSLDDLDWERGELCIRAKGGRADRLPIPHEVGEAMVEYLRHVRPCGRARQVFLRMRAPYRGLASSVAISTIVRRALRRAGLNPAHKGAHTLRHGLATHLLRRGASLAEIGELLRHRNPQTTMIYAKVDLQMLRPLALPWPGGAP